MPPLVPAFTHPPAGRAYVPAWRRPIADSFRRTAHAAVRCCVRWRIHPDTISYFSIAASALAALCLVRSEDSIWLLVAAPVLFYVRLWLNMLDGMVALASGHASARGEILNDLPDRISDVLIFAGIAHSGLSSSSSVYWAAIFALLTAYVGTLGQAVGVQREFSGVMAKPWRMVALHIGVWTEAARQSDWLDMPSGPLTILDMTCILIVAGCVQTIVIRLRRILAALEAKNAGALR